MDWLHLATSIAPYDGRLDVACARTSHHVVYCVLRDTHAGDMRIVDVLAHSRARDTQYMCHDTVAWLYH